MKRGWAAMLLLLVGCRDKHPADAGAPATPPPDAAARIADASVADSAIADAAPEAAAAPKTTTADTDDEPPPAALELSAIAIFSAKVQSIEGRRLTDGIAIGQTSENGKSEIYTAGKSKPLQNLTPKKSTGGNPFWIWGSTDEIWATSGGGADIHATRGGDAKDTLKMYRFVIPFRGDQWIGVISHYPPFYMSDSAPNVFEQLHAGDSGEEVPKVPKNIQLWSLTSLGDGKMCGLAYQEGDAGGNAMRVWRWDSNTNQRSVEVMAGDSVSGGYAKTFRGPNGDCVYVFPDGGEGSGDLTVRRLKDNHVAPVVEGIPHGAFDVTNSGTTLWTTQDKTRFLRRTELAKQTRKRYALPEKVESCSITDAREIAAVADDDLWVLADCADQSHVLLHTQPPGGDPVQKIKAP